MKQYKNKIIAGAAVVLVLALAFWWGGNGPGMRGWPENEPTASASGSAAPSGTPSPLQTAEAPVSSAFPAAAAPSAAAPEQGLQDTPVTNGAPSAPTDSPTGTAAPAAAQGAAHTAEPATAEKTCTISVSCGTILNNLSWLDPAKGGLVPADGVILPATKAAFTEGESVFDVLQRELKKAKIHLEFTSTPLYHSAYIEGIHNLYEFDCGERSGWMYRVNGRFPGYGCSRYQVEPGDRIEWLYTCDLGQDIGGGAMAGAQSE